MPAGGGDKLYVCVSARESGVPAGVGDPAGGARGGGMPRHRGLVVRGEARAGPDGGVGQGGAGV